MIDWNRVRRISSSGTITTVAGTGEAGYSGDGGPAGAAALNSPRALALDAAGNLYIADGENMRVRRVTPGGTITTIAGNGSDGTSGDGGPAAQAQAEPEYTAVDAAGNVYFSERTNHMVRKVAPDGTVSRVAGDGVAGFAGDGGPAAASRLNTPTGLACDPAGNLYLADGQRLVRKVTPGGIISIAAFDGSYPRFPRESPAESVDLAGAYGLAAAATGTLYIADWQSRILFRLESHASAHRMMPPQR